MGSKYVTRKTSRINETTGELSESYETTVITTRVNKEPDFVKAYPETANACKNLPTYVNATMLLILQRMSYSNQIHITKKVKESFALDSGYSINAINKAILELVELNIIIREERASYIVNPSLFAKGNWANIRAVHKKVNDILKQPKL